MNIPCVDSCSGVDRHSGDERDRQIMVMLAELTQQSQVCLFVHLRYGLESTKQTGTRARQHTHTHLPKHGCQSTHGRLQDIILSVSAYVMNTDFTDTSCGLFIYNKTALHGQTVAKTGMRKNFQGNMHACLHMILRPQCSRQ